MSQSGLAQALQPGSHGKRRVEQAVQRWISSLCSRTPSQNPWLSRLITGRGRCAGGRFTEPGRWRVLRMRKRWVPASSPSAWTSMRVVTKWPVPSLVVLRGDTDSMTASKVITSPGRRGWRYSCSQSVATARR
ncbi:hypothetical protein SAVIM40S_05416 [Streptomyces avidinii]